MKTIKYILYIILGLLAIFLLLGFIVPTIEYGHEITVDKPIKEAWAVQQDETKFPLWLKGFKSIELIEGEYGAIGSKYKIIVEPEPGQQFEMIETLLSKKEFDHMKLAFDSDFMEFRQTTSFKEVGGKVKVKTDSEVQGKGMMMKSMFALMHIFGDSFQKGEETNINALKKVIDENSTDYYPEPEIKESINPETENEVQ